MLAIAALVGAAGVPVAVDIPEGYVVRTASVGVAAAAAASVGAHPRSVFGAALAGFAAALTGIQVARLRATAGVLGVEPDRGRRTLPEGELTPAAPGVPGWNLDRIDQRALPLAGRYPAGARGAGVAIYVRDPGVDVTHPELAGRAEQPVDTVDPTGADTAGGDCDGHGTVVAGIAAS